MSLPILDDTINHTSPGFLSPEQLGVLQELLNIGVGRAAGSLTQMSEEPIHLHLPFLQLETVNGFSHDMRKNQKTKWVSVHLPFKGTITGSACLLLPTDNTGEDDIAITEEPVISHTWDSLIPITLTEIGNIILNDVISSLATALHFQIPCSVPFHRTTPFQNVFQPRPSGSSQMMLWAQTHLTISNYHITGKMLLLFDAPNLKLLVNAINELSHSQDNFTCLNISHL